MKLKDIKAAVLKKGWAGRTLSRQATAQRLCPLITAHMALNHSYDFAASNHPISDIRQQLEKLQRAAHTDVGKMMEVVFSCGEVPPNGTDMEPAHFALPSEGTLQALYEKENAFHERLQEERAIEHQMRTEAVINHLLDSSQKRLVYLRGAIRQAAKSSLV